MMTYPPNFSRQELLRSAIAVRNNLSNTPSQDAHEHNLVAIAYFLQELRDRLCAHYERVIPIIVTSGYRSETLNVFVNGSKRSAHCYGWAADIRAIGLSVRELCEFIHQFMQDVMFDQVIDEFGEWVHIGLVRPSSGAQRRQFLTARKVRGVTCYQPMSF
jgi:zinc D-Ala-D-Ala carboxypeptidase